MSIVIEECRDYTPGSVPSVLIRGAVPSVEVAGRKGILLSEDEQIFILRWLTENRRHLVERIEWERAMRK